MADYLTIGILIGIASGISALIVIAAVTLHRLDSARRADAVRLQRLLADLQRTVRVELAAIRRDLDEAVHAQERQAEALGERVTGLTGAAVTALREHPLPPLAALAEAQQQRLAALAEAQEQRLAALGESQERRLTAMVGELARLSEVMAADAAGHAKDLRNELLESLRLTLDEFRAAHAMQVAEVRAAVDENLQRTVERRLGETFRLVSERLEIVSDRLDHVHRGLGEVQSFAAGLGHLQRAVATVRLGGDKSASEGGGDSPVRVRAPRRKAAVEAVTATPAPETSIP